MCLLSLLSSRSSPCVCACVCVPGPFFLFANSSFLSHLSMFSNFFPSCIRRPLAGIIFFLFHYTTIVTVNRHSCHLEFLRINISLLCIYVRHIFYPDCLTFLFLFISIYTTCFINENNHYNYRHFSRFLSIVSLPSLPDPCFLDSS